MSSYQHCATPRGPEEHLRDGESCQICKDWMKQVGAKIVKGKVIAPKPVIIPEPKPKKKRTPRPRQASKTRSIEYRPCGTIAAYDRHRRAGETICEPCKEAKRIESKKRRDRDKTERENTPLKPAVTREQCGTRAGANYHRDHGEHKCGPCLEAQRAYNRETYHRNKGPAKRNGRPPHPREHGTNKGYDQHQRHKETVCDPCRLAHNEHQRVKQQAKKMQEAKG